MSSTPTLTSTLTTTQWSTIGSRCLRRSHRELVEGVDPQNIVDYLFQEDLLSVEDMEMVQSNPTRSHRMRHLLTVLHGRLVASDPEVVLRHFLSSLSRDYNFLETRLRETLGQLIEEGIDSNRRSNARLKVDQETENGNRNEGRHLATIDTETIEENEEEGEENLKYPTMESGEQGFESGSRVCSGTLAVTTPKTTPPSELTLKRAMAVSPPGELAVNVSFRFNRQDSLDIPASGLDFGPLMFPPSNSGKRFKSQFHRKIFDKLSNSVNDQDFDQFVHSKSGLSRLAERDPDTRCLILYLNACACAIRSDFGTSKGAIDESLRLAGVASSPNTFYALSLSVRVWINLKRKRLNKAERTLTQALNVVSQDPVTCSGMTAGWLYVDEAKLLMARMTSSMRHADVIRRRAVKAMEKAMEQFHVDDSADGPYGVNFASVKLASLLLACDDQLALVDLVDPTSDDLARADLLLASVDDSPAGIPSILKPLFLIACADRKFRSGSFRRAVELASDAKDLSSRTQLNEEEGLASIRLTRYSQRLMSEGWGSITIPIVAPSYSSDEADVEESNVDDDDDDDDVINGSRKKTRRMMTKQMRDDAMSSCTCSFSSQELGKRTTFDSVFRFGRSTFSLVIVVVVCLVISLFYPASCLDTHLVASQDSSSHLNKLFPHRAKH